MNFKIKFLIIKFFALLLTVVAFYSCSDETDILESNQSMSKQNAYFQPEGNQNINDIRVMAEQLGFSTERVVVEDGTIMIDGVALVLDKPVGERNTNFKKSNYRNSNEYDNILEQLGFSTKNVVVDDEFVVVEEDILFERNYLDAKVENKAKAIIDPVLMQNISDIDIFIDPGFTLGEIFAIAIALTSSWEDIPNCAIKFDFTDPFDFDGSDLAIVRDDFTGLPALMQNLPQNDPPNPNFFGTLAKAWFANNGNVGRWVSINTDLLTATGAQNFMLVVQHEVGHCIGFAHINSLNNFEDEDFSESSGQPGLHTAEVVDCTVNFAIANNNHLMLAGETFLSPLSDDEMKAAHIMYPEDLTATYASYTSAPFLTTITLSAIFDNYEVLPSKVNFELLDGVNAIYEVEANMTCGRAWIQLGGNTHPTHLRVTAFNRGGDFSTTTTIPVQHINLWDCPFC